MKKRLLVVDLGYTKDQSVIGQFPESTELKVVRTLEEAHEEVRPKYGFTWEELRAQYTPNHAEVILNGGIISKEHVRSYSNHAYPIGTQC